MVRLLISTGEVSGDLQGSFLIKSLLKEAQKRSIELELFALGGSRMQDAGARLIANTSRMGAIGLLEALPFVMPTLRVQSKVDRLLKELSIDGAILIDYMGPNIRVGNKLRRAFPKLPIIYYIAPQEWAWRLGDGGSTDLITFSDKILAIFKEEADFYSARGGDVLWVGHPMLDAVGSLPDREVARKKLGLKGDNKLLLLLPASRSQELRYLMPSLAQAAAILQKRDPSLQVFVPAAIQGFEKHLEKALDSAGVVGEVIPAKLSDELKSVLFAASDLALGKSGTINMELALCEVPQVVGYKVGRLTAFIAKRLLRFRVDHISPVNLLLKKRLVPEFVQGDFTAENLACAAIPLLDDPKKRSLMIDGYKRLKEGLGASGVTERAARSILDMVCL